MDGGLWNGHDVWHRTPIGYLMEGKHYTDEGVVRIIRS